MTILKSVALFCLKCATFSIIFWFLWVSVIRPIATAPKNDTSCAKDTQAQDQAQAYENQVARVNRQLDVVEAQQKRMEQYLTAQEENNTRFGAVLTVWEKQTSLKK